MKYLDIMEEARRMSLGNAVTAHAIACGVLNGMCRAAGIAPTETDAETLKHATVPFVFDLEEIRRRLTAAFSAVPWKERHGELGAEVSVIYETAFEIGSQPILAVPADR